MERGAGAISFKRLWGCDNALWHSVVLIMCKWHLSCRRVQRSKVSLLNLVSFLSASAGCLVFRRKKCIHIHSIGTYSHSFARGGVERQACKLNLPSSKSNVAEFKRGVFQSNTRWHDLWYKRLSSDTLGFSGCASQSTECESQVCFWIDGASSLFSPLSTATSGCLLLAEDRWGILWDCMQKKGATKESESSQVFLLRWSFVFYVLFESIALDYILTYTRLMPAICGNTIMVFFVSSCWPTSDYIGWSDPGISYPAWHLLQVQCQRIV